MCVLHAKMQGIIDSFNPLLTRYKIEVFLLGTAIVIGICSLLLYLQPGNKSSLLDSSAQNTQSRTEPRALSITIDISGAVKNPFVYSLSNNARIIDVIQRAGGLTEEADKSFVMRNINYARILSDQEKIYIPFLSDTANGYVLENKRIIDYTLPNVGSSTSDPQTRVNINTASVTELDQLPGIGPVQSEAIFKSKPYTSTEDLVSNNVIKQSVYEKIKDLISVY